MACRTTAQMGRGAEATWQGRGWPTRGATGAQDAHTWQEATRVDVSTPPRGCPCVAPRGRRGRHLEGQRDSGPWIDSGGVNAKALYHPDIYT